MATIAQAIRHIQLRMERAAIAAGRDAASVTLIAVSKTHPAEAVQAAIAAGHLIFGENRVQEAAAKLPALRAAHPALRLHLIGGLQTNKAEDAVRIADMIHTLDRPRLADAIASAADRAGRLPSLLIQVNIADEPQKSGVPTAQADSFIAACQQRFGEAIQGLMCIPPVGEDPTPHFMRLAALRTAHNLPLLSMGMSGDFEAAIAQGATHVRIGTAIFGQR